VSRLASFRHAGAVLERILAQPELVQAVRQLEPEVLHALIRHVGLEDCGELVALASREQIAQVFDADLWRDEATGSRFDARRFALWLELLVEQGATLAADKISELDEDLLVMALARLVFVIDIESLAVRMVNRRDDARDQLEKQLESTLFHELEQYRVIARDPRAFESVMTVLLELDQRDYETLARLLHRCACLCSNYMDDHGGLYQVLSAAESAEEDAAQEREERRERAGFVPTSQAIAFLKLARDTPLAQLIREERDPITKAHFRTVESRARRAASSDHDRLLAVLEEARVVTPHMKRLPRTAGGSPLRQALASMAQRDPARHEHAMIELAYLANILHAANGLRPVEAAERALSHCERGARELNPDTDLIKLFRIGFHLSLKR
jgi:uncharacterized membrane-anchored protein YhcB (DUF1043 family)